MYSAVGLTPLQLRYEVGHLRLRHLLRGGVLQSPNDKRYGDPHEGAQHIDVSGLSVGHRLWRHT